MGQALYRKYRSKSLAEIIGQEHITDALSGAVSSGRISHAYLFTGPRGVGKTSIARILAHEVNGLPYHHEDNHIDIIEIDAASNRGIDEIRDLREKVYMAPVAARYKVYIIDEVHMLTTQAFNALLKTLEEPPAHAIFILATTEAHKLPETIISRTQRYVFKPVEPAKVIAHLKYIATQEKIVIDDEALALFAAHGEGSFRDSISLLDQASTSGNKITRTLAETMLGIPPIAATTALLEAVSLGQAAVALQDVEGLLGQGYNAAMIAKQMSSHLRRSFIEGVLTLPSGVQLQLMRDLLDVAPAHDSTKMLELAILRALPASSPPAVQHQQQPSSRTDVKMPLASPHPAASTKSKPAAAAATLPPEPPKLAKHAKSAEVDDASASRQTLDPAVWNDILDALKSKYNTLYGVMRMAVPEFSAGTMTLRFRFAFHQKRMNEAKHRKIVGDIVKDLTGQNITIECIHDTDAQLSDSPISPANSAAVPSPESLATISNIFGGGELIES